DGKRIAFATNLKYPGVAGYALQVQVFGFGHLYMPFRPPLSTTLRAFTATPFDIHSGMQACDPTTHTCPDGTALALVSNAGMQQFITEAGRDRGMVRGPTGISLDDPDRDGYCEEITEGDLDVVEWYLLNHPAPTRGRPSAAARRGESVFSNIGCATCHSPDWNLPASGTALAACGYAGDDSHSRKRQYTAAGDRRFFDLQVHWNPKAERLEGKLVSLADKRGDRLVPRRGPVAVRGVYSDFKYHDVGPAFYQMQFDGSLVKQWRTTPLWGTGSTAPYGHDGADLDLDSVIRRHAGEALASRTAYVALKPRDRRDLIDFLNSLVLYQTDQLPCDLTGAGRISEHFAVQGMDTGRERFNPEWLFRVPGKIEGPCTSVRGDRITSFALTNVREAYGLDLPYLKDSDGDGFPDVIDPAPHTPGYRDGIR
ncbi:MAG TPA: di-heme oxidoredictase family protein, partial [Gemmataceae bacterium]